MLHEEYANSVLLAVKNIRVTYPSTINSIVRTVRLQSLRIQTQPQLGIRTATQELA